MKELMQRLKKIWKKANPLWKKINLLWKKFHKTRIYSLVMVLFFIAVCVGIGSAAAYIHHESDPTETAVQYFRAFMQQDYDTVMKLADIPDGGYLDRKQLISILEEQKKEWNGTQYEILDPKREDGRSVVIFRYTDEATGKKTDFKVYLNRFFHGLIPDYKISFDDNLVKDYQVTIPKDAALVINDTKIENQDDLAATNQDGSKTYTFSAVLRGTYQVGAETTYGIGEKKAEVTKDGVRTDLSNTAYAAREEYFKVIEEKTNGMLQQYYTLVRKKKLSGKELRGFFSKEMSGELKGLIKKSVNLVFRDGDNKEYEVTTMDLSDQKIKATYNKEKNCFEVQCSYHLKYECATKTSLLSSYSESYKGNYQTTLSMEMTPSLENMEITGMSIKNKKK